jgi:integrase/recombinase XerD
MEKSKTTHRYITLFLDALKVQKGLSDNSIKAYLTDLEDLKKYFGNKKPIVTLETANEEDILAYLKILKQKSFSAKTQSRRISAIRQFYDFCLLEKLIYKNPSTGIKNPKIEKNLPKFLTETEINTLLDAAEKENSMLYTLLEILYSTGLRVSELVSLKLSDIIENGMFLLVKGKGDKERVVPLTNIAKNAIQNWLIIRAKAVQEHNKIFLFPSKTSNQGYITRERFAQLLKDLAIKTGIDYYKVSPHIIRHSFASHILNSGGDLKSIQAMLGHSNISTTEIYTHILDDTIKSAVLEHHPLAKKNSVKNRK